MHNSSLFIFPITFLIIIDHFVRLQLKSHFLNQETNLQHFPRCRPSDLMASSFLQQNCQFEFTFCNLFVVSSYCRICIFGKKCRFPHRQYADMFCAISVAANVSHPARCYAKHLLSPTAFSIVLAFIIYANPVFKFTFCSPRGLKHTNSAYFCFLSNMFIYIFVHFAIISIITYFFSPSPFLCTITQDTADVVECSWFCFGILLRRNNYVSNCCNKLNHYFNDAKTQLA